MRRIPRHMGFLKKIMAAVGVGAARVDTRLDSPRVRVGDDVHGVVQVRGGQVEQQVERISVGLATRYRHDDSFVTHTLQREAVVPGFVIRPGESHEFPFGLRVMPGTPLSLPGTEVWLFTDADIAGGVDPGDQDALQVLPSAEMETVIGAAQRLGFTLKGAETEFAHGRLIQELSFLPPRGQTHLTELELVMLPAPGGLDVMLEVDRRARGLASFLTSEFESRGRWVVPTAALRRGPDALAPDLAARIRELS
ncbi:sporulation protein [Deinococcus navajonensis]|uniref:Sporulation protein n=1 Tax=Deinococcus navajonensis TaxID=309884 RepID=A0ABV8XQ54_9DEIO